MFFVHKGLDMGQNRLVCGWCGGIHTTFLSSLRLRSSALQMWSGPRPPSGFDGKAVVLLPRHSPSNSMTGKPRPANPYRRRRGRMTDVRIAVEDIGLVLAQAFQCLSLLLGEVDRARNVSVGIVFGGVDVYNIHLVVLQ